MVSGVHHKVMLVFSGSRCGYPGTCEWLYWFFSGFRYSYPKVRATYQYATNLKAK